MAPTNTLERIGHVLEKYQDGDEKFVDLMRRVKKALETSESVRVPANSIRPYPNQPRKYFNPTTLQQMANSIDTAIQLQPGMLRKLRKNEWELPVKFELIDGERRWRSISLIPAERRPRYRAEAIEADDEVVQFLIAGMANFNREGHQPLEIADTIDRYRKFGIPMEAVADLLGISTGWAYNIHGLLKLTPLVKEMLQPKKQKGEPGWEKDKDRVLIPVAAAMHISKLPNQKLQVELAYKVVRGEITLVHLRGEVVKIAEATETPIRLREISPLKKWDGREEKARAIGRYSSDLERMLGEPEIHRIIRAHLGEASELSRQLKAAQESLTRCEVLIKQARSGG